jgi:hypothetical protein
MVRWVRRRGASLAAAVVGRRVRPGAIGRCAAMAWNASGAIGMGVARVGMAHLTRRIGQTTALKMPSKRN